MSSRRGSSACARTEGRNASPSPRSRCPHHGSRFNVSTGALDLIETDRYLFSTNGNQTKHPHLEGVARTIARGGEPTLYFNYKVETTAPWDDRRLQRRHDHKYQRVYPEAGTNGLTVDL